MIKPETHAAAMSSVTLGVPACAAWSKARLLPCWSLSLLKASRKTDSRWNALISGKPSAMTRALRSRFEYDVLMVIPIFFRRILLNRYIRYEGIRMIARKPNILMSYTITPVSINRKTRPSERPVPAGIKMLLANTRGMLAITFTSWERVVDAKFSYD